MSSLLGKRVLITRPLQGQQDPLRERLANLGAVTLPFPTTTIQVDEEQLERLDDCLRHLDSYDYLIFTSQNAVRLFWERYESIYPKGGPIHQVWVVAVGPITARALQERGIHPGGMPGEYRGDAIVGVIGDLKGKRVLLPRAYGARAVLVNDLIEEGATVEEINLYRSVTNSPETLDWSVLDGGLDFVTFTSASTVHSFFELLNDRARTILSEAVPACIGPIAAAALREHGIQSILVAQEYTGEGLVQAILTFESNRHGST
jgi:uroporphyrinogen III methyltransferase / synthase